MSEFQLKSTFASLPRTTRGKPIVLNGDPKGENFLYCNTSNVYLRNIKDTSVCDVYTEHAKDTTVAKYSPSRFYIASGDVSGKVRVWDTVNPEHILKKEHPALGGPVKDIDWTMDNSKIVAVGEGREDFGKVFTYDSGNTAGAITGHSKFINSVSVKPTRPIKITTGSEDFTSVFYEGPPFKFSNTKSDHTNFVNTVRYSPDGEKYVTGGSDGKMFLYDGKSSELIGEFGAKAHKGGVYAVCFSPDSKQLLSVSGDKTAKIWDVESRSMSTEFVMGTNVTDMQVGCLWQGDFLITVSLSGYINYLDVNNPAQPSKIIKGHNKPLTALATSPDGTQVYTASSDGLIICWQSSTSECDDFKGKGHTNQVVDMRLDGDFLVTVGFDDMVLFSPVATLDYSGKSVKLDSQPRAMDSKNGTAVVACVNHLVVLQAPGNKLSSVPIDYEANCVSINPSGTEVAVGSNKNLHVYSLSNGTLTKLKSEPFQDVGIVEYSPDGAFLAFSKSRTVQMIDCSTWKEVIEGWGDQHTAKVTCIGWSPDSRRFATSSVDSHMILWETGKYQGRKPSVKAHPLSHVNKLKWLDPNTVVTVGQDSNMKLWTVTE